VLVGELSDSTANVCAPPEYVASCVDAIVGEAAEQSPLMTERSAPTPVRYSHTSSGVLRSGSIAILNEFGVVWPVTVIVETVRLAEALSSNEPTRRGIKPAEPE
jgi:hypothetical protein